jgi:DNA-binding transcriptional LysR family regulator
VVEAVVDNQADFGITQLPIKEKRLEVAKIHSDEIKLIVPTGHPLAAKKEIVASDLIGEPLLLPKVGTTRSRLTAWLEPVSDELNVSMELDSTEMIKRFVMTGLGASFMAATHCREEVAAGRLAAISLGPDAIVRQVALIYRRDKALSKAALGFINIVLEHAAMAMAGSRLALRPAASGDRITKLVEG